MASTSKPKLTMAGKGDESTIEIYSNRDEEHDHGEISFK